jgi:hypothetical protein
MEDHIPECVRECGARVDGVLRRDAGGVTEVVCAQALSECRAGFIGISAPFWSKIKTRGV